jgi:hypothetical protein
VKSWRKELEGQDEIICSDRLGLSALSEKTHNNGKEYEGITFYFMTRDIFFTQAEQIQRH